MNPYIKLFSGMFLFCLVLTVGMLLMLSEAPDLPGGFSLFRHPDNVSFFQSRLLNFIS